MPYRLYLLCFLFLLKKGYGEDLGLAGADIPGYFYSTIAADAKSPANSAYQWYSYNPSQLLVTPGGAITAAYNANYPDHAAASITGNANPVTVKNIDDIIDQRDVNIKPSNCGEATGSITNLRISGTNPVFLWTKITYGFPEVIWQAQDLLNVKAGIYTLLVKNDEGQSSTATFEVPEIADIVIDHSNIAIQNSGCGNATGSVLGIKAQGNYPLKYSWVNQLQEEVGATADLKNKPAGVYTLYVTGGAFGTCVETYGPVVISSASGLQIDTTRFIKVPANCTQTEGSIKNINIVGSVGQVNYTWYRRQASGPDIAVSTGLDLKSAAAGQYYLKITDDSGCGPVYSEVYTLKEIPGFEFHPELIIINKASCEAYASATGIEEQQYLTGRLTYEWRDSNNAKVVATTPNLTNIPGGVFYLHVKSRCDENAILQYKIDLGDNYTTFPAKFRYTLRNTCVNQNTGSITLDAYPPTLQKLRWVKDGNDFALGPSLKSLGPGDYKLYVTDELGCERFYDTFTILDTTPLQILDNIAEVAPDTCNTNAGSIKKITLVNGYPPFVYTWRNTAGKVVSQTADALNLGAGEYTLSVSDATACEGPSKKFTVNNVNVEPAAPALNDIYICSSGDATLRVINPNPNSTYRLYETADAYEPIDEQANGEFKVKVPDERSFYVSRVRGDCEGERKKVTIKIGFIITNVTNTFSPNADGVNDYWKINNVEKYVDALIQVFNRSGQVVFQSRGYAQPFNGISKGKVLPSGVYYYVITLDSGCRVSGNLTLLH